MTNPKNDVMRSENESLKKEVERLQYLIDSRPAINAGLPQTYVLWSQSIYEIDILRSIGKMQ